MKGREVPNVGDVVTLGAADQDLHIFDEAGQRVGATPEPQPSEEVDDENVRVLVVGLGNMGLSHARAYKSIEGFEIAGLCSRDIEARAGPRAEFPSVPLFADYRSRRWLRSKPDAVSINTWPDTHAAFAKMALNAGCHVFIEKPLAESGRGGRGNTRARQGPSGRKVAIGYILRVHPSWAKFVEIGKTLGKPLVMRMNLNQQSSGAQWEVAQASHEIDQPHRRLRRPLCRCDVSGHRRQACARSRRRRAPDQRGQRGMYNYGHLQLTFDDGSVGWYEAGWGPMMSETAFFVKDMIGPKGCGVDRDGRIQDRSSDVDSHTTTSALRVHHAGLNAEGSFVRARRNPRDG